MVSYPKIGSTGPNCSSVASAASVARPVTTVGNTKYPPESLSATRIRPAVLTVAPCDCASATNRCTRSRPAAVCSGPSVTSSARPSPTTSRSQRASTASASSPTTAVGAYSRLIAMHTWPPVVYVAVTSCSTRWSPTVRSPAMIAASLPPSSSSTGVSRAAAAAITARPVATPPVRDTTSMPGCVTSACPNSTPGPESMLTTPGGNAAANAAPNFSGVSGHVGGTLSTAVLPADSAEANFIIVTESGQLNGSTSAATPYGSRCSRGYADCGSTCSGASASSAIPPSIDARTGAVSISNCASLSTLPCSRVY